MSSVPRPVLFILGTATESIIVTSLVPHEYLPAPPLSRVFVRLLIAQFIIYVLYRICIFPYTTPLRHVPQAPGGRFLVGHGAIMFERPAGTSALRWFKTVPNDGLIMFRVLFNNPRLIATGPKALGELLVAKAYDWEKPSRLRAFLRWILGDGLIMVEGDVHKFQRKNIMPVFTFRHIKELHPIFWSKAIQLTKGVAEQINEQTGVKKDVVEVNHWANQVTMDIIGLAAMGRDIQALKNGQDPLIVNYEELLDPTKEMQVYFVMNMVFPQWLIAALPWKVAKRVPVVIDNIRRMTLELVQEKRQLMKTDSDSRDLLSLLIKSNNFDDGQLADQMLTFLAAGHETTSSAFTWSTYLLSKHPEIQTALRAEIHEHMPSTNEPISEDVDIAQILESLPLLNGVCQEVIRLYPTVPITVRQAIRDTELCGYRLPKGTEVILSPFATNRDPHTWGADADDFVPARWIDVDEKTGERRPNKHGGVPNNYGILTFLHGPRSCIGQGFAQAELRALVAAFVGAFEMQLADPDEQVIPSGVITTKPKNGMHLKLRYLGDW